MSRATGAAAPAIDAPGAANADAPPISADLPARTVASADPDATSARPAPVR